MSLFWEINKAPLTAPAHDGPASGSQPVRALVLWEEGVLARPSSTPGPQFLGTKAVWCRQVEVVDFYRRST